jgi:hypothetical protein
MVDITFTDPLIINLKDYYNIIKCGLSKEKIYSFLKSVEPSYKKKWLREFPPDAFFPLLHRKEGRET